MEERSNRMTGFDPATFDRVRKVIVEYWHVDEQQVTPAASLWEDVLQDDDLKSVEVVLALEEEFGIELPDEAFEKFNTVADLAIYIQRHHHEGGFPT